MTNPAALTDNLILLAQMQANALPRRALAMARLSLLDWVACGMAGVGEPLAGKMRTLAEAEAGAAQASVFGGARVPARMAAMVNGATAHALDYDDTHFAHVGHLSVGIYPAAMAVGEEIDAALDEVVAAFLVGAEAAVRIGLHLGRAHYDLGFHQTATAGAFGATVAAGRLLGLTECEMRHALGLCATRASGLKSQFGTMGKPYNAGLAASNGVECAKLAALGITSADDGLEGSQGFFATHAAAGKGHDGDGFLFEDNKYKLHACCHGTQAMIEALAPFKGRLAEVRGVRLHTNPRWLSVCDIKVPRSGLEVKFSYAWLAGMTLRGDATQDNTIYTDPLAGNTELRAFGALVEVISDETVTDLQAKGDLTLKDGTVTFAHDLNAPINPEELAAKLRAKAKALIGDKSETLWSFAQTSGNTARALGAVIRAD